MFVYKIQVNPIHNILKYGIYDFTDRWWRSSKKFQSMAIKWILKKNNNSGHELFIFKILLIAIDWNF